MEPLTILGTALAGGVAAASKDVTAQIVKDSYAALKNIIIKRFGSKAGAKTDLENALAQVEKMPDSEHRQGVLIEELQAAGVDKDDQLKNQAQALLDLLKERGLLSGTSYGAQQSGSGGLAQGPGAVAAGEGGIAVGGNVQGNITITKKDK